jgi:hypothetical protein
MTPLPVVNSSNTLFSLKHGAVNRHNQAIQSEDSARFLINDLTEQVITLRSAG